MLSWSYRSPGLRFERVPPAYRRPPRMPINAAGDETNQGWHLMNRRTCINCQSSWYSLADHELEAPHTCPRCGDQLVPVNQAKAEREGLAARRRS